MIQQGILTFNSLSEAIRQGYEVYDRYEEHGVWLGYRLRIRTAAGWANAHVICAPKLTVFEENLK